VRKKITIVESSSRPPQIISCPHFGDASPRLKNRDLLHGLGVKYETDRRTDEQYTRSSLMLSAMNERSHRSNNTLKCQICAYIVTNFCSSSDNPIIFVSLIPRPHQKRHLTGVSHWQTSSYISETVQHMDTVLRSTNRKSYSVLLGARSRCTSICLNAPVPEVLTETQW